MDKLWGVVVAEIMDTHRAQLTPEGLGNMLIAATRAQRYQLHWRILPYKATLQPNQFITLTGNLHGLPWMLLDLRGRLQPFLLRIGVGIGEMNGHIKEPVTVLEGKSVRLAQKALEELQILNSRDFAGAVCAHTPVRTTPLLTRFRTVNPDFDQIVNALYTLQSSLIRQMTPHEWKVFAPSTRSGNSRDSEPPKWTAARAAGANGVHHANSARLCTSLPRTEAPSFPSDSVEELNSSLGGPFIPPPQRERSTDSQSPKFPRDFMGLSVAVPVDLAKSQFVLSHAHARTKHKRRPPRAPHSELIVAAAGIEQLIDEHFHAALHDYIEYRKI